MGAGDFNGDGHADLFAREASGQMWLYPGDGKGGWLPRISVGTGWQGMTAMAAVGDVTGDGHDDLFARDATGQLWLYPGNGAGWFLDRVSAGNAWAGLSFLG